ncbi:MAG: amino acid adenylation domain-containing protein [Gammaproteobacteria bacterium]|nr:amino acid adenylation domain-containing protein [Gammaproteobacteria bacterium]
MERDKLIDQWNKTELVFPDDLCIHQLFESQVELSPDAPAVLIGEEKLTYQQLNSRSNKLAHYLVDLGVNPGDFVGICANRSVEMVVGIFGILKAGGAYVPLDPEYPEDRLGYMLSNSKAPVLLTQKSLKKPFTSVEGKIVYLDAHWEEIDKYPGENPATAVTPDNYVYVIYTSGSTGQPKGTLVYHRSFVNLVHWYSREFEFDSNSYDLLMSSTSFDLTQKNLYAPLITGGTLVLLDSQVFDAGIILKNIQSARVTHINCTPSAFYGLVDNADETVFQSLQSLKYVFLGGEPIAVDRLQVWSANQYCDATVVNTYGPTECTDVVAFHRLEDFDKYKNTSVPIGRPVNNTQLYILDSELNPVNIGEEGELCVAGICVGGGYLGLPELTSERFVEAKLTGGKKSRIYRTGDRARYGEDGAIEFLGRIDNQVKIRGFRIELGEIEAVLTAYPDVLESVVLAREDTPGEKRLVAYMVVKPNTSPAVNKIRSTLQHNLPDYMLPTAWVFLDEMPLTPNGKVNRLVLPAPDLKRPDLSQRYVAPKTKLEKFIADIWLQILNIDRVGVNDAFFELGGSSIKSIQFIGLLGKKLDITIPIVSFFEKPTIKGICSVLNNDFPDALVQRFGANIIKQKRSAQKNNAQSAKQAAKPAGSADAASVSADIAIIGIAGRFPGAKNVDEFWDNLREGVESIIDIDAQDMQLSGLDPAMQQQDYVSRCAPLDHIEDFDAEFFGYNPREVEIMDPQHRLFLEGAWSALERAGYPPADMSVPVGVFGGVARDGYLISNIASHERLLQSIGDYHTLIGNEKDYPATRVSYKLNLKGPSVNVQTACSSSGVAIHLACQSLNSGESEVALAGGCRVIVPHRAGYQYVDGGTMSSDGHVRTFDAKASGMVRGSGVAFVVLKRLDAALNDGDHIHAVVKSVAVNNDGSDKIGFTAPSGKGQSEVIKKALNKSGLNADAISYVEAHGTGTNLGDPIEVSALTNAYRESTDKTAFCRLGSVKSNIGHLDAGACATGVIKTVLALEHEMIPPSLHYEKPNAQIDFENSPFTVNAELSAWPKTDTPRNAGVSSFGLGGTNVHIILQEAPQQPASSAGRTAQLLTLSAKSEYSLEKQREQLASALSASPDISLADVEYTLIKGRCQFEQRLFTVCQDVADASNVLQSGNKTRLITGSRPEEDLSVVFMFTGQGAQYVGMGRELYELEPVYKEVVDYCSDYLKSDLELDLRDILFADDTQEDAASTINQTNITQPALFVTEYALAKLWMHWGIMPDAMIGHSIGEYVAACLAGVFELDDALSIVAARARFMQSRPAGKMLAVRIEEEALSGIIPDDICLAAYNTPGLCVVSGEFEAIDAFDSKLKQQQLETIPLHTSHAFHSHMMDAILDDFAQTVSKFKSSAPEIPFISSKTGTWITDEQVADPEYWSAQLRNTVRFSDGIKQLKADGDYAFLEVGPGNTLSTAVKQHNTADEQAVVIASLPHPKQKISALEAALEALGRLWIAGLSPDWGSFYQQQKRRRVPLPSYPFNRTRYWIDPQSIEVPAIDASAAGMPAQASLSAVSATVTALPLMQTHEQIIEEAVVPASTRKERILNKLRTQMQELSGLDFDESQDGETFFALGLDSLFLTQVSSRLQNEFGVSVKFRQLLEELNSLDLLSDFLDEEMPADAMPAPAAPAAPATPLVHNSTQPAPLATAVNLPQGSVQQLIAEQLQLMERQLDMLQAAGGGQLADQLGASINGLNQSAGTQATAQSSDNKAVVKLKANNEKKPKKSFGAAARIEKKSSNKFTAGQQQYFDEFVKRYTAKTSASKAYTAANRKQLADPRVVSGFSPIFKELVYPIVVERSSGSRVWDIDGNEYLDMTNGFGANLLGHSPSYITEALKAQLDNGVEIGPQHPLAGEVASMISEMTGLERVVFCNTGSEAVLGAMRLVRTVTGRNKIVMFTDDYHGMFDEVIVRGTKALRSIPAAPGIPPASVENIIVLEYGNDESLEVIGEHANEIAAVIIEPVQSRNLDLQPKAFIQAVRKLTAEKNIAMVMDEVITGFRLEPGGAQAYFEVQADIATYGKVVGGGMPIGVIAGNHKYMDALDGGLWQYGDNSIPEVGVTYFAGTFVRHPLTLAAAKATLIHLKESGPELQRTLNDKTAKCVAQLKSFFAEVAAPIRVLSFHSAFQIAFTENAPFAGMIFYLLRDRGIHITEGRTWFFTTAHDDSDYQRVIDAFKECVVEMQAKGLLPSTKDKTGMGAEEAVPVPVPVRAEAAQSNQFSSDEPPVIGARLGRNSDGNPAWFIPDTKRPGKYLQVG